MSNEFEGIEFGICLADIDPARPRPLVLYTEEQLAELNARDIICGYCGEPIMTTNTRDRSDLDRGWDHTATLQDYGTPDNHPTRLKHRHADTMPGLTYRERCAQRGTRKERKGP